MSISTENNDRLKNIVYAKFDENIPSYFIKHINVTYKTTKVHLPQLKAISYIYHVIRYYHPADYRTKSGIRIGGGLANMMCRNPYEEGTIENAAVLLEKQYFDTIFLLLGGAYRPILPILRYMLQLTTWVACSIFDKKQLTRKKEDAGKAMSHIEFEEFMIKNDEDMKKKKALTTPRVIKQTLNPLEGLAEIPGIYLAGLEYEKGKRMAAIRTIYSELSRYAHSNIWRKIRLDGGDNDGDVDTGEPLLSTPNKEGYHRSLEFIFKTNEIIYFLLIRSAYENIAFYSESEANNFAKGILNELNDLQNSIKFSKLNSLLTSLINSNSKKYKIHKATETEFVESELDESEDDEDTDHDCPVCGYGPYIEGEECIVCHVLEHGQGGDTEDIFY